MFTPPPSPLPMQDASSYISPHAPIPSSSSSRSSLSPSPMSSPTKARDPFTLAQPPKQRTRADTLANASTVRAKKRSIGRKTVVSVLLVPVVLAFITLSTRYICHPAAMDVFSGDFADPPLAWTGVHLHEPHGRRQNTASAVVTLTQTAAVGSSVIFPSSTSSALASESATSTATTTGIPTIPETAPALPTPFPQPFDTAMASSSNMTTSCAAFMANMTGTLPFRQCRAFSFLSQVSNEFLQAQTNISQLNVDVWGTCNTAISEDQCSGNMAWFADQLKTDCADDLNSRNAEVVQSLASLQTYDLLRQAGCLADSTTGAYCYVEAAASSNPIDLYLYSLPFGLGLPASATPSCSTCAKSLMALYTSEAPSVDGLKQTYNDAAKQQNARCGSTFAVVASSLPSSSDTSGADYLRISPGALIAATFFLSAAFGWL
ncbi:hypothetical protein PENSPDRAFT_685915 [Peniophora sp. CONT]|nr:hypothetical protein PENSPDRAFT_685915 [Peniophora sp. CONT]